MPRKKPEPTNPALAQVVSELSAEFLNMHGRSNTTDAATSFNASICKYTDKTMYIGALTIYVVPRAALAPEMEGDDAHA